MTIDRGAAARLLATAAGVAALLAGCRGAAPGPEPITTGAAQAYIDTVLGTSAEQLLQRATTAEEQTAACMAAQGFEYVPYTGGYHLVDEATIEPPPGSREFAEQFGYGYVRLPEAMTSSSETEPPNPNDAITAAMSANEVDLYLATLLGEDAGHDPDPEEPFDLSAMGCQGAAMAEVFRGATEDLVGAALLAEVTRIAQEAAPADPRVVELDGRWAACMADAGHPGYERQPEAEAGWWTSYSEEIAAHEDRFIVLPDGSVPEEAGALDRERELATADWVCRSEVGYDDGVSAVQAALQQEYVDVHRDELDAWVERWADRDPS